MMVQKTALKIIIIMLVFTFNISQPLPQHPVNKAKRIWIESYSSPRGWGLSAKLCRPTDHYPPTTNCDTPQDLLHRRWTLPKDAPSASSRVDRQNEGITLSVFNQREGNLLLHKIFPLWQYWAHWADLQWYVQRITPGRLVIMSVSVTGITGLRQVAKQLHDLGSVLAQHLTPQAHWTWVFIKGGQTISEAGVLHSTADAYLHTQMPLNDIPARYHTTNFHLEVDRWYYCEHEGGMGGLCDEYSPDPLPVPTAPELEKAATAVLSEVPVVLTAGSRHQYLYYTLTKLLAAPGVRRKNILVVLGHAPKSTTKLLDLLNVDYTTVNVQGKTNIKLYHFYRNVYQLISETFADAPAVIILDEDVQVSPDFFSFMSHTLGLLYKDPTLYCINGFFPGGSSSLVSDTKRVLRGSVQVEWGYAITMDFVREALAQWELDNTNTLLYDFWLYLNVRKNRECLYPEVSRTKHYGIGVNTVAYLKEMGNFNMQLVKAVEVSLHNVEGLENTKWRASLSHNIQNATPILKSPCDPDFLPRAPSTTSYVFYYQLDPNGYRGMPDYYQYYQPNKCLGLWAESEQGHHEGVTVVHFAQNATLYLVGVPYSSYSHLKPARIPLWDVDALTDKEFEQMTNYREAKSTKILFPNTNTTTDNVMQELTSGL